MSAWQYTWERAVSLGSDSLKQILDCQLHYYLFLEPSFIATDPYEYESYMLT